LKEVTAHLGDLAALGVNLGKIKTPNFGANVFKKFSLAHKQNEWKIKGW
jgi:hypothetical protein